MGGEKAEEDHTESSEDEQHHRHPVGDGTPSPTSSAKRVKITNNNSLSMRAAAFDPNKHTRGKILRIEMTDFMCHKRLDVHFISGINFITGPNGSGKSAIVAALQVCLGLNASHTGRASKLADLIRHGCDSAKICIFIQNDRDSGFLYEELGEEICVERVIKLAGASTCKILNGKTMKMVRDKMSDLQCLCDEFGLYADNPCCVMDQDEVKVFLKGTAEEKYDFFLKATDLNSMLITYEEERHRREGVKREYLALEKTLPMLKKRWEEAKVEVEKLSGLRDLAAEHDEVNKALIWTSVRAVEREVEEQRAEVQRAQAAHESGVLALERMENEAKSATDRLEAFRAREKALGESVTQRGTALKSAKEQMALAQRPVMEDRSKLEAKRRALAKLRPRLDAARAEFNALLRAQSNNTAYQLSERLTQCRNELSALEQEINERCSSDSQSDKSLAQLDAHCQRLEEELRAARAEMDTARHELQRVQNELEGTERDLKFAQRQHAVLLNPPSAQQHSQQQPLQRRRADRFPLWVAQLLDLIDSHRARFRQIPLFVGEHVQLRDARYSVPVEQAIGSTLMHFICDGIADETLLRQLATRELRLASNQLVINVRRYQGKRYVVNSPASHITTMLDVLEVDNDEVFNALVDTNKVEKMALVGSEKEGYDMFQGTAAKSSLPQNVVAVMDVNGNSFSVRGGSRVFEARNNNQQQQRHGPMLAVVPTAASASTASTSAASTARTAEEERAAAITRQAQEVDELHSRMQSLRQRQDQVRREVESHRNAEARLRTELATTKRSLDEFERITQQHLDRKQALEQECEHLEEQIQEATRKTSSAQMEKVKAQMEDWSDSIAVAEAEIKALEMDLQNKEEVLLRPAQELVQECERDLEAAKAEVSQVLHESDAFANDYQPIAQQREMAQTRLADIARRRNTLQAALEQRERDLAASRERAQQQTGLEDLPSSTSSGSKSKEELIKRLRFLKTVMEEEEKQSGLGEGADVRLLRAEKQVERTERSYHDLKSNLRTLEKRLKVAKDGMKARAHRFQEFREWAENSTRETFSELLKQKGHDGDVLFDHEARALKVKWYRKPLALAGTSTQEEQEEEEEQTGDSFSDAKSLSGGERSITTLALLIAMGRNVASPFRVMDEFDVFMDGTARKIAIEQLITDARQSVAGLRKQCIFLTPLDISEIPDGPDLKKQIVQPNKDTFGTTRGRALNEE